MDNRLIAQIHYAHAEEYYSTAKNLIGQRRYREATKSTQKAYLAMEKAYQHMKLTKPKCF